LRRRVQTREIRRDRRRRRRPGGASPEVIGERGGAAAERVARGDVPWAKAGVFDRGGRGDRPRPGAGVRPRCSPVLRALAGRQPGRSQRRGPWPGGWGGSSKLLPVAPWRSWRCCSSKRAGGRCMGVPLAVVGAGRDGDREAHTSRAGKPCEIGRGAQCRWLTSAALIGRRCATPLGDQPPAAHHISFNRPPGPS